jgi:hypothetical protein
MSVNPLPRSASRRRPLQRFLWPRGRESSRSAGSLPCCGSCINPKTQVPRMRGAGTGRRVDQVEGPERVRACPWHQRARPCRSASAFLSAKIATLPQPRFAVAFRPLPRHTSRDGIGRRATAASAGRSGARFGGTSPTPLPRGPGRHAKAGCNPTHIVGQ